MTAILGFSCVDGVLMLADTEETTSRDTKSECDKLRYFALPHGQVLLGGAGNSHFIEYAMWQLSLSFLQTARKWAEIEKDLNAFAKKMIHEMFGPYRGLAAEAIPDGIEMLIAVYSSGEVRLFNWQGSVVIPIGNYQHTSIGAGVIQMHPMLRDIRFSVPVRTMLFYGVQIMRQTKRIVQGCGGKTEAIALNSDGSRTHFFTYVTSRLEEFIERVSIMVQSNWILIAGLSSNDEDFDKAVATVPVQIKELRKEYREIVG